MSNENMGLLFLILAFTLGFIIIGNCLIMVKISNLEDAIITPTWPPTCTAMMAPSPKPNNEIKRDFYNPTPPPTIGLTFKQQEVTPMPMTRPFKIIDHIGDTDVIITYEKNPYPSPTPTPAPRHDWNIP